MSDDFAPGRRRHRRKDRRGEYKCSQPSILSWEARPAMRLCVTQFVYTDGEDDPIANGRTELTSSCPQ